MPGSVGDLFCIHWPALRPRVEGPVEAVLVLPAFAEEMNKCRRMTTLLAQASQARGVDAFSVDLTGTGDSGGEFRDATVERWSADLAAAADWLQRQRVDTLHVVAVRGGALLLNDLALPASLARGSLVLWQPITSGRQLVSQFLRLRNAEAMVSGGPAESRDPRRVLQEDGFIEVAGYDLTLPLVEGLERLALPSSLLRNWNRSCWIEIAAGAADGVQRPAPTPAAARIVAGMKAEGIRVDLDAVEGEPFWATPEIAVVPALIDRSVACFGGTP